MAEFSDERRIVTALFADVAGSTALGERLDPEEFKLVIGEAIGRAIRIVESYGGTINNLAGDGLLALFGAPVAHDDDPERALRSAVEIAEAARVYGDDLRLSLGIDDFAMRVGVHTGEVVVGPVGAGRRVEYGAVGDTINTTARLQSAAPAGQVLVSESTKRHVANLFDWGNAVTLDLKGKAKPIRAYPLVEVKATRAFGTDQVAASPFVGRDREIAAGLEVIDRVATGLGGLLFIVGEPGIGKSRLLAELRQRVISQRACTWLEGRCVSYGESLPYWPYRDLLRNWLQVSPAERELRIRLKLRRKSDEMFPGRGDEIYPYLATILGLKLEVDSASQLSQFSPESLQHRTFEVFTELIAGLAARSAVVISLDDLHWADPTSLALTEHLLALAEAGPIVLTISQRRETEHPSWHLKEKASRDYPHAYRELPLRALGHESEGELLSSLVGPDVLPPEVGDRLLAYAEGNPFYLEQLIRALVDRGTLVGDVGHWIFKEGEPFEVPQTLEAVIIARIDRLDPPWREALTAASVLGRTFGLDQLQAVTGLDNSAVRRAFHHLLRLDLLREDSGGVQPVFRFKPALIQETAYGTLVATRRRALHRLAAEWYETYYDDRLERVYGLLAKQWQAAGDSEKAARYLKLAGDRALAEWALDEAIEHYRGLADLLEASDRKHEASESLFQLGSTLHLAMRYREANAVWQQAFRLWSPPPAPESTPAAVLRFAVLQPPWDANPAHPKYSSNIFLHQQLYDRLLDTRPGPYFVPGLAERWEVSDDGRTYRFHLRSALTWNDGQALTAPDVVESVRRMLDPATQSTDAPFLMALVRAEDYARGEVKDFNQVGVHALDDRTLNFRLSVPVPYFLFPLAHPEASGARLGQGSGPFRLRTMTDDRVVIERDPRYRRRRGGNVALVEWVRMAPAEASSAYRGGNADVIGTAGALADPQLKVRMGTPLTTSYLVFSGAPERQTDVQLRKAIALATDRTLIGPYLLPGQGIATGGLVPPGIPGHSPGIALGFDPDLARRFRAESGHSGPLRLAVVRPAMPAFWEALTAGWRSVLDLDIQTIPLSGKLTEKDQSWSDQAHAALTDWVAAYPDPDYFHRWLLHSRSPSNMSHSSYPSIDALVDRAAAVADGPTRFELFRETDKLAVQDLCAVIPLIYQRPALAAQPWVHGLWFWSALPFSYDDVIVDERSPRFNAAKSLDDGI